MAAQIWLLRHGEAEPHGAKPDAERELTPRGERQSAFAGAALARLGVEFSACYASPKVRARETARLACESLGVTPELVAALAERFDAEQAIELLAAQDSADARVLYVGHNPDFADIVAELTGAQVAFKKGAVAAVRVLGSRRGELAALLRPRELEALAL